MANGYEPGEYVAQFLNKLPQLYQAQQRLDMQDRYLTLAENRETTSKQAAALENYKTGYTNYANLFDDIWKMDTTGASFASFIGSDEGKEIVKHYPQFQPFQQWEQNYTANQDSLQDAVTDITTDTGTSNIEKYQKMNALQMTYSDMGKFKPQYDIMLGQYKTKHDKATVTKFLEGPGQKIFSPQKIMRLRATNNINPTEALKEINEYDETKRTDTLIGQSQGYLDVIANPLMNMPENKPQLDAAKVGLKTVEDELKRLGAMPNDGTANGTETAALDDAAIMELYQKNPSLFVTGEGGNITAIAYGKNAIVQELKDNIIKNKRAELKLPAVQEKVALAAQAGVVLPGSEEWEKLYGATIAKEPEIVVAGATLSDTTKTTPPPVPPVQPVSGEVFYDASIGRWLTSEGKPATRGQIEAAKGKGKQAVKPPVKPKVAKPVVKKELPPPTPGEPGRMPKLAFARYNKYGDPVFKTSSEPTGTTFPKELKEYRGDYTTQEQKKFQDITKKLKSDRSVYKGIKEQKDKIKNLESKRDALDTGRSGYDKAKKHYNDRIKKIEEKKIGPLKKKLSAPEFYDQVIVGFGA
jgi:hypothetical protein|tara:strand:- start:391 stop:2136 length:1746 start_codon:yes stop_codon:yes gene_type:complete